MGDLTQVYPLARGSASPIVALVSVVFLGVVLPPPQAVAVALIGLGITPISIVRRADGQRNDKAALLALVTGCFIATHSLVDRLGTREAGTALSEVGGTSGRRSRSSGARRG